MIQNYYSFAGGPTMLPRRVIADLQDHFNSPDLASNILNIDPDSKEFHQLHNEAKSLVRTLIDVPADYEIMFNPAGAHLQFGAFPLNFLNGKNVANYTATGYFSRLAVSEAERVCTVNKIVTLQKDEQGLQYLPEYSDYKFDPDAAFVHYVDNETVEGVEYKDSTLPYYPGQLLLNDCSSNFLTKPINWNKTSCAYAHTQKNCGISGTTILIMKKELMNSNPLSNTPSVCDYRRYSQSEIPCYPSTPMTFAIYMNYKMLQFIRDTGGVSYYSHNSEKRCKKLYDILDSSHGFYLNTIRKDCRSRINVTWKMSTQQITDKCLAEGAKEGLLEFKGHRSVGGFRASLFIPVPNEGVDKLADFLQDFMVKQQ